jgi:hypothetical protein
MRSIEVFVELLVLSGFMVERVEVEEVESCLERGVLNPS